VVFWLLQGVLSSLRQLLEEGYFHADPHPGNVVVTREGVLAYFDFGMMSEFRWEYRIGLIRTLVHFVNRDSEGLAKDFVMLDFIPPGTDLGPIAHELQASFGDEETKSQLDFQGIMNQLWTVMYKFNFRLSPEYAMVVRALGSLEGTATTLDPGFKVVSNAYPFIVGRLLADPDPKMRETLRELLIRNNGSIRWHRLERLVVFRLCI
jgi:aarF domain-containing kinase